MFISKVSLTSLKYINLSYKFDLYPVQTLEPWLVTDVKISGDFTLASIVASGLPTSEEIEHIVDLEALKSSPLPPHKQLNLFIGVFSTANNFKRRMAVRRTWMQYAAVRSGEVAVHFFVGLVSTTCRDSYKAGHSILPELKIIFFLCAGKVFVSRHYNLFFRV